MPQHNIVSLEKKLFRSHTNKEFEEFALAIFRYQYKNNSVYHNYIQALGKKTTDIKKIQDIPFLPVSFFKTHEVVCDKEIHPSAGGDYGKIFYSSATTGSVPSKHCVKNISIYRQSFRNCFSCFYGDVRKYCVLALLPSYLERSSSSLVFMVEDMVQQTSNAQSGFYIHNYNELADKLALLQEQRQQILLIGVTYALLKLAEEHPIRLTNAIIMETGGMKGKREEMPRQEVHQTLIKALGVKKIHSEYGMTELLSQAYSQGGGIFNCPPWMKVLARDIYDPFNVGQQSKLGAINIIDFANIHSCSFIAADDIGVVHANSSFEIAGRIDHSDIRGCNLMAEEL